MCVCVCVFVSLCFCVCRCNGDDVEAARYVGTPACFIFQCVSLVRGVVASASGVALFWCLSVS